MVAILLFLFYPFRSSSSAAGVWEVDSSRCAYDCRMRSLRQKLLNRVQFETALRSGLGVRHLQSSKRVKDNLGDDQPRILLIVGRDDVPRRMRRAGRMEATS